MKKTRKILCLALVLVSLFALVSCSSFESIKSSFEKNGYTYVELDEDNQYVKSITADLEEGELTCTMHLFSKNGELIPKLALVLEFSSDKDLQKAIAEDGSETIKGLLKDAQESDYINGNCLLLPLSITEADSMKEIFKK